MFAAKIAIISALALPALGGANNARFEKVVHRAVPAQYRRGYAQDAELLEPYAQYNSRYMNFGCPDQHNTKFFDLCCHPRLKGDDTDFDDSCYDNCDDGGDGDDECDEGGDDDGPHSSAIRESSAPVNIPVMTHSYSEPAQTTPAPKPTTTHKPEEPKPTTSAASGGGSGGGSSGGFSNTGGEATYFYQGGNAGACGVKHSDNDLIAAIQVERYGNTGQRSSLCNKKVEIQNTKTKKTVTVTIVDACPSCKNKNSIDLSVGAFKALGSLGEGVLPIAWKFV